MRVRIPKSRSERWLLWQESLLDGERQYYFNNLPPATALNTLVRIARSRWAIEVQYLDLKSELGPLCCPPRAPNPGLLRPRFVSAAARASP